MFTQLVSKKQGLTAMILMTVISVFIFASAAMAHPLGNFTVNHFARIEVGGEQIRVRYVVDMAEIPTFQEMRAIDTDGNGQPSSTELSAYATRVAVQYGDSLMLTIDDMSVALKPLAQTATMPQGMGGLQTLRVECDLAGTLPKNSTNLTHHLRFGDNNHLERIGWREVVVAPTSGINIFDSSAFSNGLTDELKIYPKDMLAAPLDECTVELSFAVGPIPAGARPLLARDGRPAVAPASRDRLTELIAVPMLTPGVVIFGLLVAFLLGGFHALSPGHGKTVVGAYLVGTRGTARHAAFLGLTVTITHTAGVFALGLVTLVASEYIVPERLFPILSFISGALVVSIGLSLLVRRFCAALGIHRDSDHHIHTDDGHSHAQDYHHSHDHGTDPTIPHSHGGRVHSHLPPGADGSPVTWRTLLALGISGGILPCPSALVVLLAAISLHRVGYGLLLVVAFSLGLAGVLTGVGLAFVYARRFVKFEGRFGHLTQVLPVASAFVITCAGIIICYEAMVQGGLHLSNLMLRLAAQLNAMAANGESLFASVGVFGVLGLGLIYGLKHATEVDHIVAVSTIVSEHRKLVQAALVGGLWGAGHTASLVVVGAVVLALHVAIPESVASWLEFGVALMIIGLGVSAFRRALSRRSDLHIHQHVHNHLLHAHVHFHEPNQQQADLTEPHSHAIKRIGFKPTIVGAMHGLAGSAALTLLVLVQINSAVLGILYLAVFGLGSIIGMMLMSGLVGLPFVFSSRKLTGVHRGLQIVAGVLSIAFGLWYAYETGITNGLLTTFASL